MSRFQGTQVIVQDRSLYLVLKQGGRTRLQLEKLIALTSAGPEGSRNSRCLNASTQMSGSQMLMFYFCQIMALTLA